MSKDWMFEDWQVGETFVTMHRTLHEWDIQSFVTLGGFFEELWLYERRSTEVTINRQGPVPGYLTLTFAEGLVVLTGRMHNAVGMLGLDRLRWALPAARGDDIYCEVDVTEARR